MLISATIVLADEQKVRLDLLSENRPADRNLRLQLAELAEAVITPSSTQRDEPLLRLPDRPDPVYPRDVVSFTIYTDKD